MFFINTLPFLGRTRIQEALNNKLPGIKCLRQVLRRAGFDPAQLQQRPKGFTGEPGFDLLRFKDFTQDVVFFLANPALQRNKKIGRPKVAIILWDLVFQDDLIPPGV